MPSQTLIGDLADVAAMPVITPPDILFRPLVDSDRESLAQLYLDSYPPGAAVATLDEALIDVDATFAGDYGELWRAASLVALSHDDLVGSIQVVHQSPWDPDLRFPFVIELFVAPSRRRHRIGSALMQRSASVCIQGGQSSIALRTAGEVASPYALRLYSAAGMRPR